jgi:hypothetical protein
MTVFRQRQGLYPRVVIVHPSVGVSTAPGQNAAQVIVKDLGLDFNSVA